MNFNNNFISNTIKSAVNTKSLKISSELKKTIKQVNQIKEQSVSITNKTYRTITNIPISTLKKTFSKLKSILSTIRNNHQENSLKSKVKTNIQKNVLPQDRKKGEGSSQIMQTILSFTVPFYQSTNQLESIKQSKTFKSNTGNFTQFNHHRFHNIEERKLSSFHQIQKGLTVTIKNTPKGVLSSVGGIVGGGLGIIAGIGAKVTGLGTFKQTALSGAKMGYNIMDSSVQTLYNGLSYAASYSPVSLASISDSTDKLANFFSISTITDVDVKIGEFNIILDNLATNSTMDTHDTSNTEEELRNKAQEIIQTGFAKYTNSLNKSLKTREKISQNILDPIRKIRGKQTKDITNPIKRNQKFYSEFIQTIKTVSIALAKAEGAVLNPATDIHEYTKMLLDSLTSNDTNETINPIFNDLPTTIKLEPTSLIVDAINTPLNIISKTDKSITPFLSKEDQSDYNFEIVNTETFSLDSSKEESITIYESLCASINNELLLFKQSYQETQQMNSLFFNQRESDYEIINTETFILDSASEISQSINISAKSKSLLKNLSSETFDYMSISDDKYIALSNDIFGASQSKEKTIFLKTLFKNKLLSASRNKDDVGEALSATKQFIEAGCNAFAYGYTPLSAAASNAGNKLGSLAEHWIEKSVDSAQRTAQITVSNIVVEKVATQASKAYNIMFSHQQQIDDMSKKANRFLAKIESHPTFKSVRDLSLEDISNPTLKLKLDNAFQEAVTDLTSKETTSYEDIEEIAAFEGFTTIAQATNSEYNLSKLLLLTDSKNFESGLSVREFALKKFNYSISS